MAEYIPDADLTGLTPEEFEVALHFIAKGHKIVDFPIEPVEAENE